MLEFSILVTIIVFLSGWIFFSKLRKKNMIPGMKPTSKEHGNLGDLQKAGSLHDFLSQLHTTFGPIASFWWGQVYTVSIASPELFKQHIQPFDRPSMFFEKFEPMIGPMSIQFANGQEARVRRKVYDRSFGHDKLRSYYEIFQKSADVVVKQWSAKEPDDLLPLCEETFKFTVRSSLCAMLGTYFEDDDIVCGFQKAYNKTQDILFKKSNEQAPMMKQLNDALDFMKTEVKKALNHRKESTSQNHLIIDDILDYALNEDMVLSDSITYLVGSFHNTGNMLAYSLYYLALHQEIQDRVFDEIIDVLGDHGIVDESSMKNLKYMHQVIDESIRCGISGVFAARSKEEEIELGGYKIPKNTPVVQALGVVMADEKWWSAPHEFDPERFNEENIKKRHPYAFQPFGFAGKRKCPGYKFVYIKATVFLTSVLRRFKVLQHGDQQLTHEQGFSTHPAEELWVKLVKRQV